MKAFVFPGQGSQYPGMGQQLAEVYTEAHEVFEEADDVLGFSLSRLCFEGPADQLQLTVNTQPAILATSVAAFRVIERREPLPDWVAGHSLGEYSALVAAGTLSLADAVTLVRERGRFMQEAVPVGSGAMAALLGLEIDAVVELCREVAGEEVVEPANINSPMQIVIAGHTSAVERAVEVAPERGARRAVMLSVSAPFHCRLMQPAARRLQPLLDRTQFHNLRFPLVNNARAERVDSGSDARLGLIEQVDSPVRWRQSIDRLAAEGVKSFYEVGPGKVLAGLIRKTAAGLPVFSVEIPEHVEGLCSI